MTSGLRLPDLPTCRRKGTVIGTLLRYVKSNIRNVQICRQSKVCSARSQVFFDVDQEPLALFSGALAGEVRTGACFLPHVLEARRRLHAP